MKKLHLVVIFFLFLVMSSFANAVESQQILGKVLTVYQPLQGKWHSAILPFTYKLFWLLVTLDITYSLMKHVMERKEIFDSFIYLAQKSITVGFFFSIIKFSDSWISQIIDSFTLIGKTAAGVTDLTPDGVISYGYDLAIGLFKTLGELGTGDQILFAIPVLFAAIFLLLGFAVIAGQLIITLIESYIVVGGGIIMLGFSGSKWTVDMATSYLKYAVGTGVKLMLAYLIIGAGIFVFKDMYIDTDQFINSVFALIVQTAVFIFLSWNIPSLASAMMSGAPSSTLGGVIGAATTAAAAVAGTASTATNATKSVADGAMSTGSRLSNIGSGLGAGRGNSLENTSKMNSDSVPDPFGGGGTPAFPNGTGLDKIGGNASGASIGGENKEKDKDKDKPSGTPLHQKIRNAGSMVPSDQATVQTSGFNLTHGKD